MAGPARQRYRITFSKMEAMRFTGHLDLHRTWERTFRRAALPLAYSAGFNPQPKINIGAALPLGCLSEGDLIDVWLESEVDPLQVESSLRLAAPPGIRVDEVRPIEPTEPVLQSMVRAAVFEAVSANLAALDEIDRRIGALIEAEHLPRVRRGKSYDLRPLVEEIRWDRATSKLWMRLVSRGGATGRPEEVLDALGLDPADFVIRRTGLVLSGPEEAQPG